MKILILYNLIFFTVLLIAFIEEGSSFNLSRHGIELSLPTITAGLLYYVFIAIYLIRHNVRGRVILDAYNIYLLLFSTMIVPGVITFGPINGNYNPHLILLSCGIMFVATGIIFELIFPKISMQFNAVNYSCRLPNSTMLIYSLSLLSLIAIVLFSGNINRSSAYNVIMDLLLSRESTVAGIVAEYRTNVYYDWGITQVIGNYAGAVFGPFFALILFSHFYFYGRRNGQFVPKLVAILIILFPILFAIGSGSRLILLRMVLIYLVFAFLPYGIRLLDRRVLYYIAFVFSLLIISTVILGRGVQGGNFLENLVIQTEKSISRLFMGKGRPTMVVYEYYPSVEPFEKGIPILERSIGIEIDGKPSVATKIFGYLTNDSLGTAGPQTFGDLYASFSYLGQIILTPVLALGLLLLRRLYLCSSHKNTSDRAIWAFSTIAFGYLGYSDFGSFKAIGFSYLFLVYLGLCSFFPGGKRPESKND